MGALRWRNLAEVLVVSDPLISVRNLVIIIFLLIARVDW